MADAVPPAAPGALLPETFYEKVTRRKFIVNVGWGLFAAYVAGTLAALGKYMFPNVLYEPSSHFKVGRPEEYTPNTVSEKWLKDYRTWIIRDETGGIYAVWARCTHLGCTPRWFSNERRFRCPCHGSNYNIKAEVIAGPAPRPMYRCKIWVDEQGVINVDKAVGVLLSTMDDKKRLSKDYYLKGSGKAT